MPVCFAVTCRYFDSKDQAMLLFERVVKTRGAAHTHFQVIGIPKVRCGAVRCGGCRVRGL